MTAAPVEAFIIVRPMEPSSELSALLVALFELLLLLVLLLPPVLLDVLVALALGVENKAVVVAASALALADAWLVNQLWSCEKNDVAVDIAYNSRRLA
jgi:hypothetical protein